MVDPSVCLEIREPQHTILGAAQDAWLDGEFTSSRAAWNIVAQQTLP